jgi:hypothetical protein
MFLNKMKSAALAATTISLVLSVGFAAPASAVDYTITADREVIRNGESVTYTTTAPGENLSAFFINGEYWGHGSVSDTPNPFDWGMFQPCANIRATYRVYDEVADEREPLWTDPYAASNTVRFVGDPSIDCDDSWGAGKSADEPLAKTGTDASTVAGLTGVAGVAALAIAGAVARRMRRAQR